MGKPYYWAAATDKERSFFIGSLVKIYRKYTGGKTPELIGFTPQEEAQFIGGPSQRTPDMQSRSPPSATKSQADSSYGGSTLSGSTPTLGQPSSLYSSRAPSREGRGIPNPDREMAASRNGYRPTTREGQRTPAREEFQSPSKLAFLTPGRDGARDSSRESSTGARNEPPRQQPSREMLSSAALQPPDSKSRLNFTPQSSQSSLQNGSTVPTSLRPGQNGTPSTLPSQNDLPVPKLTGAPSFDSLNRSAYTPSFNSRPSTAASGRKTPETGDEKPSIPAQSLPDRQVLRPRASFGQKSADSNNFATPVTTPSALRSEAPASKKSTEAPREEPLPSTQDPAGYFPPSSKVVTPAQEPSEPVGPDSTMENGTSVSGTDLSASPPRMTVDSNNEEEHRPGLGPMIKKKSAKDIASTFRRAALAATAFQPRAGGAGARLMAQKERPSVGPDGINAVVPAPLSRGMSSDSARSGTPDAMTPTAMTPATEQARPFSPVTAQPPPKVQIQRTATEDSVKAPVSKKPPQQEARAASPDKARSRSPTRRRRQRQEADIEKYCNAIGIDPKVIDGRGGDRMDLLDELGWDGKLANDHTVDDFAANIRREIGRAQATGWLGHIEQQDEKIKDLGVAFDKVVDECEQLDQLLTLYGLEMDTLREDVEYIEAQSQGLQVSTANQKLLQVELQGLLQTLNISFSDLRALHEASLDTSEGVQSTEQALCILYQAMLKIDPDIRQNKIRQADGIRGDRNGVGVYADTDLGQMRAVREKKEQYQDETVMFVRRLNQFLVIAFTTAEQRTEEALEHARATSTSKSRLDSKVYDSSRHELWMYNALLLFVREVNSYEWKTLVGSYEMSIKSAYQEQFRDHVLAQKKSARSPTGEESGVLFTTPEEKTDEGLASRKMTIKRSKTSKPVVGARQNLQQDGKMNASDLFAAVMDQQTRLVAEEQNYIVAFFHLSSQHNDDFAEIVNSNGSPAQRRLPNLRSMQSYEPDREMARIVQQSMDNIYAFWPTDMHNLIEWVLNLDQLQGVGILRSIEVCLATYEETNQEYITGVLRKLHERLMSLFHRFIDTQITAIEETKVKISKRKGVIPFMNTFPIFSATVESMLPAEPGHESLEVRFAVNEAYGKINKAMWESLTFIAKEPGQGGAAHNVQIGSDPEDKEALNFHILLIENANHYIKEVDTHSNVALDEWKERAVHEYHTHINLYVDAVIRRPLGKWLDFVESTEALLKSNEASPTNVASKPSHSRSTAKKLLASFDLKEVRKGVETLKKRIEKHFGEADEPALSRGLVEHVFSESSSRYATAHERMKVIIDTVYEGELGIDWRKEEVAATFKR